MNTLIKKLAQQADPGYTGKVDDDMSHALVGNDAIEHFAKLIAYEILSDITNDDSLGEARIETIRRIAAKFGIEQ